MHDEPTYAELQLQVQDLKERIESQGRAYEELSKSANRNQHLIEQMPNEVHVWQVIRDDAGEINGWRLEYANPSALRMWNKQPDEVFGKTAEEIFPGGNATESFLPIVQKIFTEKKPHLWEQHFAGTDQILQMISIPSGDHFISTGLDVTELRELEKNLQHAEKMDAIGQLAGGVAHDFNNQLMGILGYAQLLEHGATDPEQLDSIKSIQLAAQRSADLTAQLLAFARSGPVDFVSVDIKALIEETISLLRISIDKMITVHCHLDAAEAFLLGDSSLLESALLNIALNARDAMPAGGELSFDGKTVYLDNKQLNELSLQLPEGNYYCIEIRDTGTGIPANILARIFDPFFTTKDQGNGMGLASVYGTVQRHNGEIVASSEIGKGSCFSVYLPIAQDPAELSDDLQPKTDEVPSLEIIVVDDEPSLCRLYSAFLSRRNHRATTFCTGKEALAYYSKNWESVDLVILDMNMPEQNGLEVFQEMKAINPGVKALVATGYGIEGHATSLRKAGIRSWLQKPFDETALNLAIAELQASG